MSRFDSHDRSRPADHGAPLAAAATTDAETTHSLQWMQQTLGNQAMEQLLTEGATGPGNLVAALARRQGMGQPLAEAARSFLEPRLGVDLSDVRVHTDGEANALAQSVQATAFTSGRELYFGAGAYDPATSSGLRLLAHEVTHVVQQASGPVGGRDYAGVAMSEPAGPFGREADAVADAVMSDVAPPGPLAALPAGAGGSGATVQRETDDDDSLWGSVGSWVSDAGASVSDAAGAAWSGASDAAGAVADFGAGVYAGMKQDAADVRSGVHAVDGGIDWLEDQAKGGTHWLAQQAAGIPVAEQLASAAESAVDFNIDVTGGALKGVNGMLGGLAGMAANPVDAVSGLYGMAEHLPVTGVPLKALHGAYDLTLGGKDAGQVWNELGDPRADDRYWGNMARAVWAPMQASIDAGKPGEALGNAGIQIAAMFTGAGEAGAAAEGAEAASLAAEMAEAGEAAGMAGEAGEAAELAEAAEAAEAAESLRGLPGEPAPPLAPTEMPPTQLPPEYLENPQIPSPPQVPSFPEVPPEGFPVGPQEVMPPGKPGVNPFEGLTDAEIDAFVEGMEGNVQALGEPVTLVPYHFASEARSLLAQHAQQVMTQAAELRAAGEFAAAEALESQIPSVARAVAEGRPVEAMHLLPQSVGEGIAGYDAETALTYLEERPIHRVADKQWIREFKDLANADETIDAASVERSVGESMAQSPQSSGVQQSLRYRLQDEMAELGINPADEIRPYRPRKPSELPPGVEELDFSKPPPEPEVPIDDPSPLEPEPDNIWNAEDFLQRLLDGEEDLW